jgi:hypothetical protein
VALSRVQRASSVLRMRQHGRLRVRMQMSGAGSEGGEGGEVVGWKLELDGIGGEMDGLLTTRGNCRDIPFPGQN